MKKWGRIFSLSILLLPPVLFIHSQKKPSKGHDGGGSVGFRLVHMAGKQLLAADKIFTNEMREQFSITRFRYYISNIEFTSTDGRIIKQGEESYFLVDEEDEKSKNFSLPVTDGTYNEVSFLLGVDSLHNVSGAQSGALDPMNGMFWTWKSGYIMAKLEGKSPASSLPGNIFEYHIGGFKGKDNVLKRIRLPFPEGEKKVSKEKSLIIEISVDLLEWFQNPEKISIASQTACTTPGALAKKIADNYADMFSIRSINE